MVIHVGRNVLVVLGIIALLLGTSTPILFNTLFKVDLTRNQIQSTSETATFTPLRVDELISGELKTFKSYDNVINYLLGLDRARTLANELISSPFSLGLVRTVAEGVKQGLAVDSARTPGTNIQVLGVDEPDVVKCDGNLLVVASSSKVYLVSVKEKEVLNTIVFKNEQVGGMFLHGNTLIVITISEPIAVPLIVDLGLKHYYDVVIPPGISNTSIYLYDTTSPENPKLKSKVIVTGLLTTSRMSGGYVYLITSLPMLRPTIPLVNDSPVRAENIFKVDSEPTTYTTIVVLDVVKGGYTSYAFMTGHSSWLYMSLKNLYLASSKVPSILEAYRAVIEVLVKYLPSEIASKVRSYLESEDFRECIEVISDYLSSLSYDEVKYLLTKTSDELSNRIFSEYSKFYVFSVSGVNIELRGGFEVAGRVLDQFSMEEVSNYFVVATTSTNSTIKIRYEQPPIIISPLPYRDVVEITECNGSICVTKTVTLTQIPKQQLYKPRVYVDVVPVGIDENNVFTVNLKELKVVGSLRGLAKGERIYSSRLIGNILYLVTYRQVDPLFAIDISNPEKPEVLGYLKIPGFSEYLHPLPNRRLLGIGVEDGFKISLFDVSDPTNMREISKVGIASAWSIAYSDHHAVTVDLDNELVFIPVSIRRGTPSGILAISYKGDVLTTRKFIEHEGAIRTTYVNDELYTISLDVVKVFNIRGLNLINEIKLS